MDRNDKVVWKHYLGMRPGPEMLGEPAKADCIVVFAFGRNEIPDAKLLEVACIADWFRNDKARLEQFSSLQIGMPNLQLAENMRNAATKGVKKLFVQWEVAIGELEWSRQEIKQGRMVLLWPPVKTKNRFDSRMVGEQVADLMLSGDLNNPLILAHRWHVARAYLIMSRLIRRGRPNAVLSALSGTDAFDRESVQPGTRSLGNWIMREILARAYCLVKGYV